ncbi:hypothetical protein BH18ACI4_BH18ACI4_06960 [soil metagenome]
MSLNFWSYEAFEEMQIRLRATYDFKAAGFAEKRGAGYATVVTE